MPQNAPGDFYVEADQCLRCCLPHGEAPELMNDCKVEFRECYFRRQPQTPEEVEHAIQAIWVSELHCIRYGGSDQTIIRRLHELGREDCCDQPLLGEPAMRRPNRQATPQTRVMSTTRRYIECGVFVAVWMACGWLFHLSNQSYLILGIPWLMFFQLVVARRPLSQLWVRESGTFRLDRAGAALTGILMVLPVLAIAKQRDSWVRMLPPVLAVIGAAPAAFALRRQRGKQLRQALPAFAVAIGIGVGAFMAFALHDGRSPVLGPSQLPLFGFNFLLMFPVGFIIEEVVFRGAIDTHVAPIAREGGRGWMPAVFTSVLWGLWHFPLNPSGSTHDLAMTLVLSTVLGVPLSICWRRSGTLVLPATAHALIDAYRNALGISP
ncbi:MAG TPA: type II CAAX endopeptidase family protein [Tepidisphaeraceae bacterium]